MGNDDKDKTASVVIPQVKDAMLVPNAHIQLTSQSSPTVFEQNWAFAQQWKRAKPQERTVVEVNVGANAQAFLAALTLAAQTARGRTVYLFVGHGGAADFRGLTTTIFDTVPENGKLGTHKLTVSREVLQFETIAQRQGNGWVPRPRNQGGVIVTESQATVDALSPRFEMLKSAGTILVNAGVSALVVLACNIAKDPPFLTDLQTFLGVVHVGGYSGLIALTEVIFTQPSAVKEMIWVAPSTGDPTSNQPAVTDVDQTEFHEVPPPILKP